MLGVIDYLFQDNHYMSIIGIIVIIGIAVLFSNNKRSINPLRALIAFLMQVVFGFLILKTTAGIEAFKYVSGGVEELYKFAGKGTEFVFGPLADARGPWGFVFAIKALPVIVFFSALMALLFHLGIVQIIVKCISFVMRPILGTSGAETLSVVASSMLGQTEAPLLVKNYMARMTNSEMHLIMLSGMAHLSGSILAVYGMMGVPIVHMMSASVMAVPGAILISKILVPEVEEPETSGAKSVQIPRETKNVLDAVSSGTSDGLRLAVNVAAMLIAFISLMALIDYVLVSTLGMGLNVIFGKVFCWVAYLIGIPGYDTQVAGTLLGQKLAINEFVAYAEFIKSPLADRSRAILTYALAGFANFSSMGIQIGGLGAICPSKREFLTKFGLRALLGGTLVNLLNAAIASLFI